MFRSGSTLFCIALSSLLVLGCAQDEQAEVGEMEEPATEIEALEPTTAEDRTIQIDLEPRNDSGISGVTRVNHRADGAVEIVVNVEGAAEGTQYEGHLHRGTCQEGRGEIQALETFTLSGADATSTTIIRAGALEPSEEEYFVEVHAPAGTVVACSDLPRHEHPATGTETGAEYGTEATTP